MQKYVFLGEKSRVSTFFRTKIMRIKGFHVFPNENYANQPVIPNE